MQVVKSTSFCALAVCAAGILQRSHKHGEVPLTPNPEYYWPHARGHPGRYSITPRTAPTDLNASFSWSWHHPEGVYHTVVVSGPLIDDRKNVYIASEDGIRKFSPEGKQLWFYAARGSVSHCPSLHDGALFGNSMNGWVYSLDLETGQELWALKKADSVPTDTGYVEAHEGVVVTGVDSALGGGATRVLGLDSKSGLTLWEYKVEERLWNIMPVFPGDGSFVVMDIHGGVMKHALHNSSLLWKTDAPRVSSRTFSDGGVMLGPDGRAYSCSNYQGTGQPGQAGVLRAYRQDGLLLWEQQLKYPCNSWPAVTPDESAVIVPAGAFVASPAASDVGLLLKFQKGPEEMQKISLALGSHELQSYGMPQRAAAIQAFDTHTGELLWSTELPPYGRLAAAGDEEGLLVRRSLHHRDQCLPAQFGAPTISGDGTIYVGRADGLLYAVESGNGKYHTFDTKAGFLHPGTSWAPGMMAVTSCDGLFVWNY